MYLVFSVYLFHLSDEEKIDKEHIGVQVTDGGGSLTAVEMMTT